MRTLFAAVLGLILGLMAIPAHAQQFSGLARVDPLASGTIAETEAQLELMLGLSQGVPYRLFTLAEPSRLVLDFREVDWTGLDEDRFRAEGKIAGIRFGVLRPGWSRLVIDLAQPMEVKTSDMRISEETGHARLSVRLGGVSAERFAAVSGAPTDPAWGVPLASVSTERNPDGRITVLIDPGHGGIDPGAEREGLNEKELMLAFGFELRDALLRIDGIDVVMTRTDDSFVSLERRVSIAHQVDADLFISLHADVLSEGRAHGAVAYTLSDKATDQASALLAERHNRADMLAGVDLTGRDDIVADVLLDLARMETQPRAEALARNLIGGLKGAGAPLNRHPHRSAAFSVLKAADIPSILLEIGFLSSDRDMKNLIDPVWRQRVAEGLRDGIQAWLIEDAATRELLRQ